jgi:hypothetical protein
MYGAATRFASTLGEKNGQLQWQDKESLGMTAANTPVTAWSTQVLKCLKQVKNREGHFALMGDLVDHVWARHGVGPADCLEHHLLWKYKNYVLINCA